MTETADPSFRSRSRIRPRRVVFGVLVGILVLLTLAVGREGVRLGLGSIRTTPVYDPPVLAGQQVAPLCSGGVYAKTADGTLVITTTGHCANEGDAMTTPDDHRLIGRASAPSGYPCDAAHAETKRCTTSDMAYVSLEPSMIPWGHLNLIDMGAGGYRTVQEGTAPLSCDEIAIGDSVESNGRKLFRTGTVVEKGAYEPPGGTTFFPCIVGADILPVGGDSGGVVLVNGTPAGVSARMFMSARGPILGFTPLAEGLAEMGLTMCDTPDCGLVPPDG